LRAKSNCIAVSAKNGKAFERKGRKEKTQSSRSFGGGVNEMPPLANEMPHP